MRRKFATNLLFLFAANLLVKPFWIFGVDRVVQNNVGAEVYGTYFAVFNYSFLLSIILDFGINNFNNRAVSRNNKRAGEYLLNLLFLKFWLSLLYFAFTFITAIATGFSEQQMQMLLFLAINQILLSVILYLRSNLAALQLFKTDSLISILDRLLAIVFCLLLLYGSSFSGSFNIMSFIYAQTLALFITVIVAFTVVIGKTVLAFNFWKLKFTRLILLQSIPFALLGVLMGVYYRIDSVMLERMLPNGAHEAGVYAASFRLLDALNQFGFLFATLLLPMFAGMLRKRESVSELVKFSATLLWVLSVIVGVSSYFFRHDIMSFLYHDSNDYWATIFGWLMLTFIPMSSIYIFGTLLTAKGNVKILNMIAAVGVLVNVGLNLYLIPRHGALGATIATLFTQSLAATAHIGAAKRQSIFEYRLIDTIKPVVYVFLCVLILYAAQSFEFNWIFRFTLSLLICLVVAGAMQMLPVTRAFTLLKSKATS